MRHHLITAGLALVFGFIGAGLWQVSGVGDRLTRNYLIENADVLPEMAQRLQRMEMEARLAEVGADANTAFPGAVLGNPNGSKIMVKFSDYACGYCRQAAPDIAAMIAADPDLKVVLREYPIFPGSEVSARMALAAAKQGRFAEFHEAMFSLGQPTTENVRAAAEIAKLDMEQAQVDGQSDEISSELAKNYALAQRLGFTGTPSWVINGRLYEGAIGRKALENALEEPAEG